MALVVPRILWKLAETVEEMLRHEHLADLDWKFIDRRLTEELVRITSNHLCRNGVALPYRGRRRSPREKRQARELFALAVKQGKIVKPTICEQCKRHTNSWLLHGHHEDYSKPFNVIWLCIECHSSEHARIARVKRALPKRLSEITSK